MTMIVVIAASEHSRASSEDERYGITGPGHASQITISQIFG